MNLGCEPWPLVGGDGVSAPDIVEGQPAAEVHLDLYPEVVVEKESIPDDAQAVLPLGAPCSADSNCDSLACRAFGRETNAIDLWVNLPPNAPGGVVSFPVFAGQGMELRLAVRFLRGADSWEWRATISDQNAITSIEACKGEISFEESGALEAQTPARCAMNMQQGEHPFVISFGNKDAGSTSLPGYFDVLHVEQDGRPNQLRCVAI